MKPFFKELFEYNNTVNQKVIAAIIEHSSKASEKCIQLQSHILNVHRIWNAKFNPVDNMYGQWQIHPIENFAEIDIENFNISIHILDQFDLNAAIKYVTSKGKEYNNSAKDILFQIINHSTYHRAQIATEFRLGGLEPLMTDYIFYKWK